MEKIPVRLLVVCSSLLCGSWQHEGGASLRRPPAQASFASVAPVAAQVSVARAPFDSVEAELPRETSSTVAPEVTQASTIASPQGDSIAEASFPHKETEGKPGGTSEPKETETTTRSDAGAPAPMRAFSDRTLLTTPRSPSKGRLSFAPEAGVVFSRSRMITRMNRLLANSYLVDAPKAFGRASLLGATAAFEPVGGVSSFGLRLRSYGESHKGTARTDIDRSSSAHLDVLEIQALASTSVLPCRRSSVSGGSDGIAECGGWDARIQGSMGMARLRYGMTLVDGRLRVRCRSTRATPASAPRWMPPWRSGWARTGRSAPGPFPPAHASRNRAHRPRGRERHSFRPRKTRSRSFLPPRSSPTASCWASASGFDRRRPTVY